METIYEAFHTLFESLEKNELKWVIPFFAVCILLFIAKIVSNKVFSYKRSGVISQAQEYMQKQGWTEIDPVLFSSSASDGVCEGAVIVESVDGCIPQYIYHNNVGPFIVSPGAHTIVLSIRMKDVDFGQTIIDSDPYMNQSRVLGPWTIEIWVEASRDILLMIDAVTQEMTAYYVSEHKRKDEYKETKLVKMRVIDPASTLSEYQPQDNRSPY